MSFDTAYYNIGMFDRLAYQDTVIHRLDSRVKVAAAALFVLAVVSYPKYEVVALTPYSVILVLLATLGDIPASFLLKKVLIVSPFAVFVGLFNPLFDGGTVLFFGRELSAGWVSFLSILVKFTLTISAAVLLIATTSFPGVCHALRRFGFPALFVSQLLFLYRYLFVLAEEAMRIVRARDMRSFGGRGNGLRTASLIIGMLFLRTVERAERVYTAMLARGFAGEMPSMTRRTAGFADLLFLAAATAAIAVFRLVSVPELVGRIVQGVSG